MFHKPLFITPSFVLVAPPRGPHDTETSLSFDHQSIKSLLSLPLPLAALPPLHIVKGLHTSPSISTTIPPQSGHALSLTPKLTSHQCCHPPSLHDCYSRPSKSVAAHRHHHHHHQQEAAPPDHVRPPPSPDIDHEQFNMEPNPLPRLLLRHNGPRLPLQITLPHSPIRNESRCRRHLQAEYPQSNPLPWTRISTIPSSSFTQ